MDFEYNGNLLEDDRINLVANEIVNKYPKISIEKAKEAALLEGKISSNKTINIANVKIKKLNYKKLKHNNSYIKEKINFNGKIFPYRKNFKFIVDPLPYGKTEEFKDFSENIKKIDRKAEKLLKNDNKKIPY